MQMWIAAYLYPGLEGSSDKNGTYTGDFKVSVIEYMHKRGLSARANICVIFIGRENDSYGGRDKVRH
ncbi:hypothetical protein UFO1_1460 [Pelosinus sp. UFO1]|nr:hypothetical protein UFO1_1460 [Pelosinus sp. UFO1]